MSADRFLSRGIKRSVKDRLGGVCFSPYSFQDQQQGLKRQRQDDTRKNHIVFGEKILVKRVVPETSTSAILQKNMPRIVKNASLSSTRVMPEKTVNMSRTQAINAGLVEVSDIKATPKNRAMNAGLAGVSVVKAMSRSQPEDGCPPSVSGIKASSGVTLISSKKAVIQSRSALSAREQKKQLPAEDLDVPSFLETLGLSKYVITFKAEEVDMFALKHMNEGDLKEIGLPMGPRKKVLLGLASARTNK